MADKNAAEKEEKGAPAEGETQPKKKKTPIYIGSGAVVLLTLAYMLATMAVPKAAPPVPHLEGPFVAKISKTDIQVNLAGESSKRYLVMSLNAEYMAYEESYVTARIGAAKAADGHGEEAGKEDPLYTAMLKDGLLKLAATRTRDQVTDPVLIDAFLEEIKKVVDPVLFPVYIGDAHAPMMDDHGSGLRLGESIWDSKFRGLLHDHALKIDARARTIAFDDGATVAFEGRERDLALKNSAGDTVYVDVTHLNPEFAGSVPIGVPGKVRRIYRDSFLVQ